ncbi:MAG TPA: hypothetical protein VEC57_18770 [Candidatus Limnocylindrales bacterium]|nr:hypothetical protein [Candidatus Limnocylindrales bacterium]
MRSRAALLIVLAFGALLFIQDTGSAGPRRRAILEELTRLRGDVAQLTNQLSYVHGDLAKSPPSYPGGGSTGLCDDPCAVDSDGDGVGDCEDYCPCDPDTADADGDGAPDCADPCPDDATDACADPCNQDSDGDGTGDCEDPCPWDPAPPADADEDGVVDCQDPCPGDPTNECWGPCGIDQDGDGVGDCIDDCPYMEGGGSPTRECKPMTAN